MLSAVLAAACLGFLFFNFNPARIFMGDSGSRFLGLALALLSILGVAKVAAAAALLVPVVALAVPIADTALAIVRRRRGRLSIAHADTKHIHHRLLNFGLSQRHTCLVFYGATAVLGAVGLTVFGHRRILVAVVLLVLMVLSVFLGEWLVLWGRRLPIPGGRIVRLLLEARSTRF
ncbi:MraY family glycosyltransferase [Candidatus Nephthysia bennettiae]|uniref:MraY family glycosyltransferase n=1 Tax=Candidatus Nephthysia bennettiae TaxID=3127016 RepID=UPI0030C69007